MIEHDYIDVDSDSDSDASDEMDSPRSNSPQPKVASEEANSQRTTKQSNDISTREMSTSSDAGLGKAFKDIIDLLEEMDRHHTPCRCPGPFFKDLRSGIVKLYDLAKDADNNFCANLRLLPERLPSAQLMRNESGLALEHDVRLLRHDLSKLTMRTRPLFTFWQTSSTHFATSWLC